MKILYINAVYGVGSTGRSIQELREYCINQRDEVYVASCTNVDDERFYTIGNCIDYKIHAFFSRLFNCQAGFSSISTERLIRWVKRIDPDVIQINNVHSNYINIYKFLRYTGKQNIAVVLVLDDCWYYTGNCCHYTTAECYKWKENCGHCTQLKKWNKSFFYDGSKKNLRRKKRVYTLNQRLGVIGVSSWIADEARKSILKSAKQIECIYNSVNREIFHPVDASNILRSLGDRKIILGVANYWDDSKGLNYFNKLAKMLDDKYKIVLVGEATKNTIDARISHINRTDSLAKLVSIYCKADVFLQLSVEESFGKVCVEAMACGTPIAVFDSTASPELVGYRCGAVVAKGDIVKMKETIIDICSKGKEYYSNYCQEFVMELFDREKNLEKYREFYKSL